ncbi:MAG: carboxypeptidase-like regulatory domain-containing protein [candidate division Zixibacteria bacterium]|nr:carboxypeptidase-like regulatory domain-containing protein [candidate division Zixibacteria bacterium]
MTGFYRSQIRLSRYRRTSHTSHYLLGISIGFVLLIIGVSLFTISCDSSVDPPPPQDPCQGFTGNVSGELALPYYTEILYTVEGIIRDHYDDSPVPNVSVSIDWIDSAVVVTSDSYGYFYIPGPICPGEYEIVFTAPGFAVQTISAYAPSLDELKGDIDVSPSGSILYPLELDVEIYGLTGSVSGVILDAWWELLICPDGSVIIPPVMGAEVELKFRGQDHLGQENVTLVPDLYWVMSNVEGYFAFVDLPLTDSASLTVPPFVAGDSSYGGCQIVVPVPSAGLVLVPGMDTVFQVAYQYFGYDSSGFLEVSGWLAWNYVNSTYLTGIWRISNAGGMDTTFHMVDSGRLAGIHEDGHIFIDLNPGFADANTLLSGTVSEQSISGTWQTVGFIGVLDSGSFIAVRK